MNRQVDQHVAEQDAAMLESRTGVRNDNGGTIPPSDRVRPSDRNLAPLSGDSELLTDVEWDALIDDEAKKGKR